MAKSNGRMGVRVPDKRGEKRSSASLSEADAAGASLPSDPEQMVAACRTMYASLTDKGYKIDLGGIPASLSALEPEPPPQGRRAPAHPRAGVRQAEGGAQ